jgi:hypothetical protein
MSLNCFSELNGAFRVVGYILACCILLGFVLLVIGIVLYFAPDYVVNEISEYNDAVETFNLSFSWNGTITGTTATMTDAPVPVKGYLVGVASGVSRFAEVVIANTTDSITFVFQQLVAPINRSLSRQMTMHAPLTCDLSSCNSTYMSAKCAAEYRGSYAAPTGDCLYGSMCGMCDYTGFIQSFCAVVDRVNETAWRDSATYETCEYPFSSGSQIYGVEPLAAVPVRLYDSGDPYIALQRITLGSNVLTQPPQVSGTGTVLIVVGVMFVVMLITVLLCMTKKCSAIGSALCSCLTCKCCQRTYYRRQRALFSGAKRTARAVDAEPSARGTDPQTAVPPPGHVASNDAATFSSALQPAPQNPNDEHEAA